ncbi:MAG: hypothetical protein UW81_C0005G0017 [Candidatus Giovannonibacteria bacterium GW2011_GWC2_44_9]|uniref:Uncharacterized protein n=3 Tax=Candidatus Giovannoniibacteriota TaxID=1752738 RepID=A0A0G1LWD8_9BACT|nr:MAG: hypothetical protein UW49_C0007G0060 [Candidatus Giovannonibacteria bacterium GW2011_GWB1_44_23]KKT64064.1 MAG: hypothetical protein UW57_C0003G0058 [Candidatus Giovannonibacteria bacterium GW2011_GWA1_44_29]KKT84188.1 MAG: hypothetical protein UW81_C0005G0017 [Candidatus Giovannonibacteria bacterium GW2011_GWC2_44_9]KKT91912.1 MAG: hypothetical protein UW93_C0002G0059 [Parcubacteria group bacterium GW2011_GWC1_45_13]
MRSNTSYSSPKVEMQNSPISGRDLFAKRKIKKGELLVSFESGKGKFINSEEADKLYVKGNDHMLQVDDDLFFAAANPGEDWKIPELQEKYKGYFSEYLQKKLKTYL